MFTLTATFNASREEIYNAWLSTEGHTAMTDAPATASAHEGGEFTAWNGYISGRNLQLLPGKKIVQAWRTLEFPEDAPDSTLTIELESTGKHETLLTLTHKGMPQDQEEDYKEGWQESYFDPMQEYFSGLSPVE